MGVIDNPLADNFPDHEDQRLVRRARSGDRQALEDLVQRHQAWIYNIAVRMLYHPGVGDQSRTTFANAWPVRAATSAIS